MAKSDKYWQQQHAFNERFMKNGSTLNSIIERVQRFDGFEDRLIKVERIRQSL